MSRWLGMVLILAMLATLLPGATAPSQSQLTLQPVLRQLAADQPEQVVNVIVQRLAPDGRAEALVAELGGWVSHDLSIINSFAADLPAAALPALADSRLVRFVSLNAGMVDSQVGSELVYTSWAGTTGLGPNSKAENFRGDGIAAGRTIWFNGIIKAKNFAGVDADVTMTDVTVRFTANGEMYQLDLPAGRIQYRQGVTSASTIYDAGSGLWVTTVPSAYDNETFVTGFPFQVQGALPGGIRDVTWSARVLSSKPDAELEWRWGAAVYSHFSQDYNSLGVKPVKKSESANPYMNDDLAGTPENFKGHVVLGARGSGGTNYTGDYSSSSNVMLGYADMDNAVTQTTPDALFMRAGRGYATFAGVDGMFTPGYVISKVEVVLRAYVDAPVSRDGNIVLSMPGWNKDESLKKEWVNGFVGQANTGNIYVDVTSTRDWQWYEIRELQIGLDHTDFELNQAVHVDAVGLRVISLPGTPVDKVKFPKLKDPKPIEVGNLASVFNQTIGATTVWNEAPLYLQGHGVTVAIVDSGIGKVKDLGNRKFQDVNFNREFHDGNDKYGHGTFVAGVAAGNGHHSKGEYIGVAPNANVINVRVSNDHGMSTEADVIAALSWVVTNKDIYNIRVINMSLNSSVAESYHVSPLSAAVEFLWFKGIVVVVSAGNNGTNVLYPPANDPFVITVGATDDRGTPDLNDDLIASFSAYGVNAQGVSKPDLVAPGKDIVMYLPSNGKLIMGQEHGNNQVSDDYFRMSGTSIAAPMVTGAVALLLQDEPTLTPDQVKFRLMSTARQWPGYDAARAGAGSLDISAAIRSTSMEAANRGNMPSEFMRPVVAAALGSDVNWNSVNWNSVNWNSVNWNSVNWNSVNWNSVNWNSVNWNSVNWNSVNWNSDYWGN